VKVDSAATRADLAKLQVEILSATRQILGQLAAFAQQHAKATTAFKDRSGRLRASIRRGQKGPWALFVAAGGRQARYAQYIESGSKPHEIKARRAKLLRFEQNGTVVFRKRVYHPGTKPARFMSSARDAAEAAATQFVESGLSAAMK